MRRRRALLAALFLASTWSATAAPKAWPDRPITIVVAAGAGTPIDASARAVAAAMQKTLYQPVNVENRAGADGATAANFVRKAPPDGYTLLLATSPMIDLVSDLAPISTLGGIPYAILVNPKVPVRSVQELIAYGQSSKLSYATTNAGEQVVTSQFAKAAGIEMTRVPYGASPIGDLAAGKVQVFITPLGRALADSKGGRVRLLATLTPERTSIAPSTPSFGEETLAVPPASLERQMLLAPPDTPADIRARLAREVQVAIAAKPVKAALQRHAVIPKASSPGELARLIADDRENYK